MTRVSISLAAGAAAVALLFAACGGNDDDRISASELSDIIQEDGESEDITSEQADCIAEAFVESDISDEGLDKIVESPDAELEELDLSSEDEEAASAVVESSIGDCFDIDSSTSEGG